MTPQAMLNVYQHYNTTGNTLEINENIGSGNMRTTSSTTLNTQTGATSINSKTAIPVEKNKRNRNFNNYYNIMSSFDHERFHKEDYARDPDAFIGKTKTVREREAIDYQRIQSSWEKTTINYKAAIQYYYDNPE